MPNAALLGAFAALTGVVTLEAVTTAIRSRFPGALGEANTAAAVEAHHLVEAQKGRYVDA
jgi:pyruvate ferredoxin oxidoreductase gamma subunit